MTKLRLTLIITLLLSSSLIYSQNDLNYGEGNDNKNSIYGDVGFGIVNLAFIVRLNYERQIYKRDAIRLMGRTGLGLWSDWTAYGTEVPLTLQAIFFKSNSHLELGIGASWYKEFTGSYSDIPLMLNFGYRFQNQDNGFLFRINAEYSGNHLIPLVSFGKSF